MGISLGDIFDQRSIKLNLEHSGKEEVFQELVTALGSAHPEFDLPGILAAVKDRESKMSTGIASGVAIPHGYCRGISGMAGAIGISPGGIDYGALDNQPVHVVFLMVMGEDSRERHLRALNRIFTLVSSEAFPLLREAKSAGEIQSILVRFR